MTTRMETLTAAELQDRSRWCSEAAQLLRDSRQESQKAARDWWEAEGDPAWLEMSPRPGEDMTDFADRLQAHGLALAEQCGERLADEDGHTDDEETAASDEVATVADKLADYFIGYLCERFSDSRHVRRVASWIGFLLKAIERIAGESLARSRNRQITFEYRHHRFKVRFNHHAGARGGIEVVEVLGGRGAPEGDIAITVTSLSHAESAYRHIERLLDKFIAR